MVRSLRHANDASHSGLALLSLLLCRPGQNAALCCELCRARDKSVQAICGGARARRGHVGRHSGNRLVLDARMGWHLGKHA
eukprot:6537909-Lingulodinium_polyedra.AAC.1